MPSLPLFVEYYSLKTLNLWFWFGAFVTFTYGDVLSQNDPDVLRTYSDVANAAKPLAFWLHKVAIQPRVAGEEQAEVPGHS